MSEFGTSSGTEGSSGSTGEETCADAVVIEGDFVLDGTPYTGALPREVRGSVLVGNGGDQRRDLSELRCLLEVDGVLEVSSNPALLDISSLANLRQVGGKLSIAKNDSLVQVGPFPELERTGGTLIVAENDSLVRVGPFPELEQIAHLQISGNPRLEDVQLGGSSLRIVPDPVEESPAGLTIVFNEALREIDLGVGSVTSTVEGGKVNLSMLGSLESADLGPWSELPQVHLRISEAPLLSDLDFPVVDAGEVVITGAPRLGSLEFLSSLRSVEGVLRLSAGEGVKTLEALSSLRSVGFLFVGACTEDRSDGLRSLDGIENLEHLEKFGLATNPELTDISSLLAVVERIEPSPELLLLQNNPQLSSGDVEALVDASGSFLEDNPNICGNAGEPPCVGGVSMACSSF